MPQIKVTAKLGRLCALNAQRKRSKEKQLLNLLTLWP
jgi:hypothetical protein